MSTPLGPPRPDRTAGRFRPDELEGADAGPFDSGELADALRAARDLEATAADSSSLTFSESAHLVDRVMATIATEPLPTPARVPGGTVRAGVIAGFLTAFGDAWHVAWRRGVPLAVRAQAFGLVLVTLLVGGSIAGLAATGALNYLEPRPTVAPVVASPSPSPRPTETPAPSVAPIESPVESPAEAPVESPASSMDQSEAPPPTNRRTESPDANETAQPGGAEPSLESPTGSPTPSPTPTATPRPTARPTETPEPTDDEHRGGGETPQPTLEPGGSGSVPGSGHG